MSVRAQCECAALRVGLVAYWATRVLGLSRFSDAQVALREEDENVTFHQSQRNAKANAQIRVANEARIKRGALSLFYGITRTDFIVDSGSRRSENRFASLTKLTRIDELWLACGLCVRRAYVGENSSCTFSPCSVSLDLSLLTRLDRVR